MKCSTNPPKRPAFGLKRAVSLLLHEDTQDSDNDTKSSPIIDGSPNSTPADTPSSTDETDENDDTDYGDFQFDFSKNYDMDNFLSSSTDLFETSFNWMKDESFINSSSKDDLEFEGSEIGKDIMFF